MGVGGDSVFPLVRDCALLAWRSKEHLFSFFILRSKEGRDSFCARAVFSSLSSFPVLRAGTAGRAPTFFFLFLPPSGSETRLL